MPGVRAGGPGPARGPRSRLAAALLLSVATGAGACQGTAPRPDGDGRPPGRVSLRVAGRAQAHSLSCESRSACDLLAYFGIRVAEEAFLAGLPRSDNPEEGFVGDVDDPGEGLPPAGYGVYERPVAARLRALGLPVRAVREWSLEQVRAEIAAGRPVLVWATGRLDAPPPHRMTDSRGRTFSAVRGEHTFLVVGYDGALLELLDPATGERKSAPCERFAASWAALGRRAVVVRPPSPRLSQCPAN